MKIQTLDRSIVRSGNFPESQFKIAATSKAFEILSSRLYTDSKLAIVRELSTNARDSHIEAGNVNKPFDVHLPNYLTPYFSIRDYGTGLSPESVEKVYTTYFASTRNDSNEYTGALGLGSKSPFSYTDQFTVSSFYNGTVYVYSAFKNEHGEPSIALLSENPTTEPNGLEIKLNIAHSDESHFIEAAKKVYRYFKVKPRITGVKLEWPVEDPIFSGKGYRVYEQSGYDYTPGINVVMGEVCYPANHGRILNEFRNGAKVHIEVEIGECEFAASREEIHYTDKTIEFINSKLTDIVLDIRRQISLELQKHSTLLDKFRASKRFGTIIETPFKMEPLVTQKDKKWKLTRVEARNGKIYIRDDHWQNELTPSFDTNYIFIENDLDELKQKHKSAIRYYIESLKGSYAVGYLAKIEDRVAFFEFFGPPAVKVSDLPEAPKAARVSNANRSYIKFYTGDWRVNRSWDGTGTISDSHVCVPRLPNGMVILNGQTIRPDAAFAIAKLLGKELCGITQAYYDRLMEESEMDDLESLARQKANNLAKSLNKYQIAHIHHSPGSYILPEKFLKQIGTLSDVCKDMLAYALTKPIGYQELSLLKLFDVVPKNDYDFSKDFNTRYPLLSHLDVSFAKITDVIEYINLKENN